MKIDDEALERLVENAKGGDPWAFGRLFDEFHEVPGANEVPGSSDGQLTRLEAALGNHVLVLEALADRLPEAASDGISRALEASQKALEKLERTKPSEEPGQ